MNSHSYSSVAPELMVSYSLHGMIRLPQMVAMWLPPLYMSENMSDPVSLLINIPLRDSDGQPRLSEEQLKASPVWRRAVGSAAPIDQERTRLLPQDILQQIVTDCSVCASISVCLEHTNRFGSNVRLVSQVRRLWLMFSLNDSFLNNVSIPPLRREQ